MREIVREELDKAKAQMGDEAYANPIGETLASAANRRVGRGALYTALERLEVKGLVGGKSAKALDGDRSVRGRWSGRPRRRPPEPMARRAGR